MGADTVWRGTLEVNERHKRLVARRDELEAILSQRHFTDEAIAGMVEFAERRREGAENADHATKRRLLDTLDARIIVENGKARMECTLINKSVIELRLPCR